MSARACSRVVLAAIAVTLALGAAPAHGALVTYVPDPAADGDDWFPGDGLCQDNVLQALARCSLRAAIEEANALPQAQRIELQAARYTFATPLPAIASDMEIVGKGARQTILDAEGRGRVLLTNAGNATVSDLTLTGGVLTAAGAGAGVLNAGADLTLARVAVLGNVVKPTGDARGGGIYNASGMDIVASLVAGNRAEPAGTGADGEAAGGGIASEGQLNVVQTTVHGNVARPTDGRSSQGGGISIAAGYSELRHVTFSDNLADKGGNGGNLFIGTVTVLMRDSVLVGGSDGNGAENCAGQPPLTLPSNIDSGTTCGLGGGNFTNTDPLLAPFGPHGGETDTRPPLQSTLQGGAGDCSAGKDQRGTELGAACDFGAVERVSDAAASISASRSPVPAGGDLTLAVSASSVGWDPVAASAVLLTLPAGVTLVSTNAPGGTCLNRPGPPFVVNCEFFPLVLGQAMTATVRAPASGSLTFTGTVVGDISESGGANDSASVTVPVLAPPATAAPKTKTTSKHCTRTRRGTRSADHMIGGTGSDRILGGRGADTIEGRGGDDCLYGQDGNDTLSGGLGRDTLSGGAGNDTIKARDGKRDTISCGKGRDRVTADSFDRIARDCETKRRS